VYGESEEAFARWLEERPDQRRTLEYRVHDTRHTTATYLLAAGVDPRIVMAIMGSSQMSMLTRYQHVFPSMLRDAATRLEAVFPAAREAV
jgi:integrase